MADMQQRPDARQIASLRWALDPNTDPWVLLAYIQRHLELHGALFPDDWTAFVRAATRE